MTASAVLSALRNVVDPFSARLKEVYLHSHPMRGLYETIPMGPDVNLSGFDYLVFFLTSDRQSWMTPKYRRFTSRLLCFCHLN